MDDSAKKLIRTVNIKKKECRWCQNELYLLLM